MSDFQHGDKCIGRSQRYIASGYFVGFIRLMDGTEYAVLQPKKDFHQFSLVYSKTLQHYDGSVIYRDRSDEGKEPQPLRSNGGK